MLPTRAGRSSINMEGGARSDSLPALLDAVVAQTRDRVVGRLVLHGRPSPNTGGTGNKKVGTVNRSDKEPIGMSWSDGLLYTVLKM